MRNTKGEKRYITGTQWVLFSLFTSILFTSVREQELGGESQF